MKFHGILPFSLMASALLLLGSVPAIGELCCTDLQENFSNWPLYPNSGQNCNSFVLAQSFSPEQDFVLCKVDVVLDTAAGGNSATLYVQDGPTASAYVYTQVTMTGLSGEGWFSFDVPDIQLFQNDQYFIRVTGNVLWRRYQDTQGGDPYPRGAAYQDGQRVDDHVPGHVDNWFKTFTYEECSGNLCCTDLEENFSNWPLYPNIGNNCNVYVLAQSFSPVRDFQLCKVDVILDAGPTSTTATLYVQDGPTADATVYTQVTVNNITGEGWVSFDVPDIMVLQDGDYYIRVTGSLLWRNYQDMSGGDPYPRGYAYFNGQRLDDQYPGSKIDFWFKTFTYEECAGQEICDDMETDLWEFGHDNQDYDGTWTAQYTTNESHSPDRSIQTALNGGGFAGHDADRAYATRTFPHTPGTRLDEVSVWYNSMGVVNGFYELKSVCYLRVYALDGNQQILDSQIYCVLAFDNTSSGSNWETMPDWIYQETRPDEYETGAPDYARLPDGSIQPPAGWWYRLKVSPVNDLDVDWAQVAFIKVDLVARGVYMAGDSVGMYWDDYCYRVSEPTGVPAETPQLTLQVDQNAPNPFNPATRISFMMPQDGMVEVKILDIQGRLVATLLRESVPAGWHEVEWHGRDQQNLPVASGIYFYAVSAHGETVVKKMAFLK